MPFYLRTKLSLDLKASPKHTDLYGPRTRDKAGYEEMDKDENDGQISFELVSVPGINIFHYFQFLLACQCLRPKWNWFFECSDFRSLHQDALVYLLFIGSLNSGLLTSREKKKKNKDLNWFGDHVNPPPNILQNLCSFWSSWTQKNFDLFFVKSQKRRRGFFLYFRSCSFSSPMPKMFKSLPETWVPESIGHIYTAPIFTAMTFVSWRHHWIILGGIWHAQGINAATQKLENYTPNVWTDFRTVQSSLLARETGKKSKEKEWRSMKNWGT